MAERMELIELTADIVAAHVSNNNVAVGDVPNLVQRVFGALESLDTPAEEPKQEKTPVVSVRSSIKPDFIVCMECGRKQKTLKRHLMTSHGMTPDQYREDYGLPKTYPMVAPNYSERRSEMAKSIGLGRKGGKGGKGGKAAASAKEGGGEAPAKKAPRRGRKTGE